MPEDARERRADRLALDRGADFADPRVGLLLLGRRAVEFRPRDDALVQQTLHPLEVEARQLALRLERRPAAPAPAACRAAPAPRPRAPTVRTRTRCARRCPADRRSRSRPGRPPPCRSRSTSPATPPAARRSSSPLRAAAGTPRPARSPFESAGTSRTPAPRRTAPSPPASQSFVSPWLPFRTSLKSQVSTLRAVSSLR